MNYRNRGERCPHGFLRGVVSCPACGETRPNGRKYISSQAGIVVINKRGQGRARQQRAVGYTVRNVKDPR